VLQQHPILTGFADPDHTLHDQLEKGAITVRNGIERFTENGVIFSNDNGKETEVDFIIFATGYKQACEFLDPNVVDMRFEREGNDVPLYKFVFPIGEYNTIGFINFVQSITFQCAELQSRLFLSVFLDQITLPSDADQRKDWEETRQTLCARYLDRQQLRVQAGIGFKYYDEMARLIGCYPSLWKILTERPTALWHAWFIPMSPSQYRLVGPGRLEIAEQWLEMNYYDQFFGTYHFNKKKEARSRLVRS